MTSKELLEKMKQNMLVHLEEVLRDIIPLDDHGTDRLSKEEVEDIDRIQNDIKKVDRAETIGEIADIACDEAWDVYSWSEFIIQAACEDSDQDGFFKIVGDIPDHWST